MAGIKPPTPRIVPVFRFATAIATFLFVITFVINGLISLSAPSLAAARVPSAVGAAAPLSAQQESAPAAQAPALPLPADTITETPASRMMALPPMTMAAPVSAGAGPAPMTTAASTPEITLKSVPSQPENSQPIRVQRRATVPFDVEILFGILALGFGITAWILPRNNESNFHKKWNKK